MSKFAKITKGDGFSGDLKKLLKRYRSLEDDLENFIKAQLFAYHKLQVDNHGVFPINNLGFESPQVYKAKKLACKALDITVVKGYLGSLIFHVHTPIAIEAVGIF